MRNLEIIEAKTGSPEWLNLRQSGIGGSDVAAMLGLSRYKSPYQLFMEKRGEGAEVVDNWAMKKGRAMEPFLIQDYSEKTGREVRIVDGVIRDDRHPFLLANLDGFTQDERIVEAKTARSPREWGEPGSDEVPQGYLLQVQHYMLVTAYPVADITVSINDAEPVIYTVPADKELQGMILDRAAKFWDDVQNNRPPEPTTADDVAKYFKHSSGARIFATAEIQDTLASLVRVREGIKGLEAEKENLETVIKKFMGEADTLCHDTGAVIATWKEQEGARRVDSKRLRTEQPHIYAEYSNVGEPLRRFLLK